MSPPVPPPSSEKPSQPAAADDSPAEGLDLEEDIAPNLGGEDQMQDA